MRLHLAMSALSSHLMSGLPNASMIPRCISALMICMPLEALYVSFKIQSVVYNNMIALLFHTQEFLWGFWCSNWHCKYVTLVLLMKFVFLHLFPFYPYPSIKCISQFSVTELCDVRPEHEANVIQQRVTRTPRNVVFKGTSMFLTYLPILNMYSNNQLPNLSQSCPTTIWQLLVEVTQIQ